MALIFHLKSAAYPDGHGSYFVRKISS